MIAWIVIYIAAAANFLAMDAVWLSLTAKSLYKARLGGLIRDDFSLAPAAGFYLLYIIGILVFAVAPALDGGRWTNALARGALLGLVAYSTYDLTNQATMRGWSSLVTVADLCWGTAITGIVATTAFFVGRWAIARF